MKYSIIFFAVLTLAFIVRFFNLTSVPPALHGDEMGVSYNAYSLLTNGRDEYGLLLPLTFRNDLAPLDVYLSVTWIAIFGLNEFSTRIHSVVIGLLTIIVAFAFVNALFKRKLALLTLFMLALSPWHVHTSRIGLGVNSALLLQLVGVVFFVKYLSHKRLFMALSFLSFGVSTYAYHSAKLTAPLLIIAMAIIYFRNISYSKSWKLFFFLFTACIVFPTIIYFTARPLSQTRFGGINIFLTHKNSLFSVPVNVVQGYFSHFNPNILFFDSRKLKYFQIPDMGMFHRWEIPFMLLGFIIVIWHQHEKKYQLLLAILVIAPTAASLTLGVPFAHFNRVMLLSPALSLLTALGLQFFSTLFLSKKQRTFAVLLGSIITIPFIYFYLHSYFSSLPYEFAEFWGTHRREAALLALDYEDKVAQIIIANEPASYAQMYIYLLFYGHKNPSWLQSVTRQRNKIIGYNSFAKYQFRVVEWEKDSQLKDALIIASPDKIPPGDHVVKEILLLNGKVTLRIAKMKSNH